MKFKYKYFVEVETEMELPVLGYNIKDAAIQYVKDHINYILDMSIKDSRTEQEHTIQDRKYRVKKYSQLHNIQDDDYPGLTE